MIASLWALLMLSLCTYGVFTLSLQSPGNQHRRSRRSSICEAKYLKIDPNHSACLTVKPHEDDGVSDEDKKLIVAEHNKYRGTVNPPATNMMALKWDDEIAMIAQKWASSCKGGHDSGKARTVDRFYVGQNVYASAGGKRGPPWSAPVKLWYDEVTNFKYGEGAIEKDKAIGHYTQVVWAETRYVGCAYARCGERKHSYICNYGPGGNVSPRIPTPYKTGNRGSECPPDAPYRSKTGLCGGTSSSGDSKPDIPSTEDKKVCTGLKGQVLHDGEWGTERENGKERKCRCKITKRKVDGKIKAKLRCRKWKTSRKPHKTNI